MQRTSTVKGIVLYPVFLLLAAAILYPLAWMVYSSFKENADIFANVFALPSQLYLGNYITVFTEGAMGLYFRNSLFISIVSVAGLLVFSSLAAYAFATFQFRGSTALFLILLLGLMVPPQALIISGFKLMSILESARHLLGADLHLLRLDLVRRAGAAQLLPVGATRRQGRGASRRRRALGDVQPDHAAAGASLPLDNRHLLLHVGLERVHLPAGLHADAGEIHHPPRRPLLQWPLHHRVGPADGGAGRGHGRFP